MTEARAALPLEERALFIGSSLSWRQRIGRLVLLVLCFSALMVVPLRPQLLQPRSVADLGDPLFYVWRIAWVSHQILRDPLGLFHTNQFYPERFTLMYSDSSVVPMLMSAPLVWLGVHPVIVYNILVVSTFVLSGVTMFLLVLALTARTDAALVAGTLFALYPFRFEHYQHLDLLMTMWMPLTLWGLHRTLASGRLRDGLATGVAFALQTLSSLYSAASSRSTWPWSEARCGWAAAARAIHSARSQPGRSSRPC